MLWTFLIFRLETVGHMIDLEKLLESFPLVRNVDLQLQRFWWVQIIHSLTPLERRRERIKFCWTTELYQACLRAVELVHPTRRSSFHCHVAMSWSYCYKQWKADAADTEGRRWSSKSDHGKRIPGEHKTTAGKKHRVHSSVQGRIKTLTIPRRSCKPPQWFLWCLYDIGNFSVKTSHDLILQNAIKHIDRMSLHYQGHRDLLSGDRWRKHISP